MRNINSQDLERAIIEMIFQASFKLPKEVCDKLTALADAEKQVLAHDALRQICDNFEIAEKEQLPLCQDTGTAVFFVEMGHEIILNEPIGVIINRAVKKAYHDFYLRKSMVVNPLYDRKNSGDNLPASIHLEQVAGDKLQIVFMPKGGGAENKSRMIMLTPGDGEKGIIDFVKEALIKAGGSACPPFLIGIGIGGTFDTVGFLSKKALWRPLNEVNNDRRFADLEKRLFFEARKLNIGAMGLGGREFIQAVHVEYAPCHIASLPCAVNIQCHSARSAKIIV